MPVKYTVNVGDIIVVGADNKRRIYWPLGCITQVISCKDGKGLVKVRLPQQDLVRPVQRIYPLEITSFDDLPSPVIPRDLK